MYVLLFVSHDFELKRTWFARGVDCQSRTGLILYIALVVVVVVIAGTASGLFKSTTLTMCLTHHDSMLALYQHAVSMTGTLVTGWSFLGPL